MRARRLAAGQRGMTLVELLISLTIAAVLLTATLRFFTGQSRMFNDGASALAVVQNYRFAVSTLSRDLRTAGSGVGAGQPFLVYAGPDVVAFNADYLSTDPNDLFAVYVDSGAPPAAVQALAKTTRITIPGTSFSYPDTTYRQQGTNGGAETLTFFFAADTGTARGDDFVLMRQANGTAPAVVARNLLRTPGLPFLEYLWVVTDTGGRSTVETVPAGRLPLAHRVPVHGAPEDRADSLGRIDRIRGVRVNLTATNGLAGAREVRRAVTRAVRLANAGVAALQSCGDPPVAAAALTATPLAFPDGRRWVELAWSAAADESGGERDILRYVIWRRVSGSGSDWGDPFVSVPSGNASYSYVDEQPVPGTRYDYALAAQDCTPSLSPLSAATGVHVQP